MPVRTSNSYCSVAAPSLTQSPLGRVILSNANRPVETRLPATRTRGEIEAAVCDGMRQFEIEYMGRGPRDVHAHLIGDLVVVRLTGALTAAEQHLAKSHSAEKGRDLLKQVRTHLIETARPIIEKMILACTGIACVSLHHDISTITGEKIMIFTLADSPCCREKADTNR